MGRKRMFVWGVVLFTDDSVLCAVAGSVGQLVLWRVVQGVGAALLIPASLALVVQGFDLSRRAHGVALWGAAAAIASGLGPPIGGALVALYSWRLAFLVNLPAGAARRRARAGRELVESRSPGVKQRAPTCAVALLLGACLGLLTTSLIKGPDWGWSDLEDPRRPGRERAGCSSASCAAPAGCTRPPDRPGAAPDPLVRDRQRGDSGGRGRLLRVSADPHPLPQRRLGVTASSRAGLAVAPAAFVAAGGRLQGGEDRRRVRGHRVILVPGALVSVGQPVVVPRPGRHTAGVPDPEWLPGQLLQGLGVGATLPVLGSAALAKLPKGDGYATASAVVTSARQLGAQCSASPSWSSSSGRRGRDQRARLPARGLGVRIGVLPGRRGRVRGSLGAPGHDPHGPRRRVAAQAARTPAGGRGAARGGPRGRRHRCRTRWPTCRCSRTLSTEDLAGLEAASEDVELDAGTYLFHQGDPSDGLYVLRSGRLQVRQGEIVLTELGRGAVLGELGLLTDGGRSASIRAVRDSRLINSPRSSSTGSRTWA